MISHRSNINKTRISTNTSTDCHNLVKIRENICVIRVWIVNVAVEIIENHCVICVWLINLRARNSEKRGADGFIAV